MAEDRVVQAISIAEEMLVKLKAGLIAGEPLDGLERLAQDMSMATLAVEVMISSRNGNTFGPLLVPIQPERSWVM